MNQDAPPRMPRGLSLGDSRSCLVDTCHEWSQSYSFPFWIPCWNQLSKILLRSFVATIIFTYYMMCELGKGGPGHTAREWEASSLESVLPSPLHWGHGDAALSGGQGKIYQLSHLSGPVPAAEFCVCIYEKYMAQFLYCVWQAWVSEQWQLHTWAGDGVLIRFLVFG